MDTKDFLLNMAIFGTPWKINMKPTNHPFRKENDTSMIMFHVNLRGCIYIKFRGCSVINDVVLGNRSKDTVRWDPENQL